MCMKAIFDVHYSEGKTTTGVVLFENWSDQEAIKEFSIKGTTKEEYIPGQFYKLELPCILKAIEDIDQDLDTILIDGYVWLSPEKLGLGGHLFDSLHKSIPVIGVAKNFFYSANNAIQITRGISLKPLYITSLGIDQNYAANIIKAMYGSFRIPDLIKRADQLSRG